MDTNASPATRAAAHPYHDALAHELRGWYTTSTLEVGYVISDYWFGYLGGVNHPWGVRLILTVDDPGAVPRALGAARAVVGTQDVTIWVEGRDRTFALDSSLRENGCTPVKATTHLALVGDLRVDRSPIGVEVRDVGDENLAQWVATKIRCFDDSEEQPDAERLASEIAVRRPEMTIARFRLATIDDEPVGVLGYYAGDHQLVFNLATRVPYRHRGVAQALLAHWIDDATADGCRSFMINANDPGEPAKLYRRMGFVDEVYWYQRYLLAGSGRDVSI